MGAKNIYYPLRGVNFHEPVLVAGSFSPDVNTTYPHAANVVGGARFTVSKTGTGTYVVTMSDNHFQMVAAYTDTVGAALTNGSSLLSVNCSALSNKQVTMTLVTNAGAVAEPTSVPAGTVVTFILLFKDTATKN